MGVDQGAIDAWIKRHFDAGDLVLCGDSIEVNQVDLEELLDLVRPSWREQVLFEVGLRQLSAEGRIPFEELEDGSWAPKKK